MGSDAKLIEGGLSALLAQGGPRFERTKASLEDAFIHTMDGAAEVDR
jgi:hypothetical protein